MGYGQHFDYEDRRVIEISLNAGLSTSLIAKRLGASPSSIVKEIQRNCTSLRRKGGNAITCANHWNCNISQLCRQDCRAHLCKECTNRDCTQICSEYSVSICPNLGRKPHVCNACGAREPRGACRYLQIVYSAKEAHEASMGRASQSRRGLGASKEELETMLDVVKPLILKGQSPNHIWATHPGEFPITVRTFYKYVDEGVLDICNLQLPRKVRYKPRKRKKEKLAASMTNPSFNGRRYTDYLLLPPEQRARAVQMDCVEGARGSKKVILTLLFSESNYQAMLLLEQHTLACVASALDYIERILGLEQFRTAVPILLTDHGHEFNNFSILESSCTVPGETRCRIYYCDPNRPDQKGTAEKNHVELRKLLPKGTSFSKLTSESVAAISSHVNSYARQRLKGQCPLEIAERTIPNGLIEGLGTVRIEPGQIVLKAALLEEAIAIYRRLAGNHR